jgi:CheY-like chemotaxis protein
LHRDPGGLTRSAALFAENTIRQGGRVVMFITPATAQTVREHLTSSGFDPDELERSCQVTIRDAHGTLNRFLVDGVPDWAEAHRAILEVMDECQEFQSTGTRAYSELGNILWRRGAERAAIRLEEFQNVLAHYYPFSLFCGHTIDAYDPRSYAVGLREISRTHDHIVPSEDDELFQTAIDAASRSMFGVPVTDVLKRHPTAASDRLPLGQRTMLSIMQNTPAKGIQLLEKARQFGSTVAASLENSLTGAESRRLSEGTVIADPHEVQRSGKLVLIVDDDDDFRDSLVELLRNERFHVEAARSAPEALEKLRAGLRPGLILLDMHMDVMNGWEFRAEQKRVTELSSLPVVVITASRRKDQDFADFEGCIRKPLGFDDLRPALLRFCG